MRALPVPAVTEAIATPAAPPVASSEAPPENADSPAQNQLNYANGLFGRKLYDLAVPEYEKFLGLYPNSPDRVTALFYLGQAYRALNRLPAARTSFQTVIRDFADAELAGPASYGLAEIYFNEKDYGSALPLFHRAAAKVKASALALSARYFEARCLENLERKDEARDVYQQVIAIANPNPFRDDSRLAVGSIFLAAGRKGDALKQFEALAGETGKPALKAEATVRAGLVALDLAQSEKGKPDKAMTAKATALLQKGRNLPESGRWSGVAAVGLLRLEYQAGQYAQAVADYQKSKDQVPEEVRPEMMLLAGNSQRQLGHFKEAQELYRQIMQKYPAREEAKDAQYQRLIGLYNSNDPALREEIDAFLQDNPDGERGDQAKLLKAEALYKEKDFAAAAPLYTDLRDSKLSAKLRAEAAFKLGWCYVQTKESEKATDAFGYFLQAFPDNPQLPSALAQRALAYQNAKNYDRALSGPESAARRLSQGAGTRSSSPAKSAHPWPNRQSQGNGGSISPAPQGISEKRRRRPGALLHRESGFRDEGLRGRDRGDEKGAATEQGAIRHARRAAHYVVLLLSQAARRARPGSGCLLCGVARWAGASGNSRMARPGILQRQETTRRPPNI